jgi:hypothetical protein
MGEHVNGCGAGAGSKGNATHSNAREFRALGFRYPHYSFRLFTPHIHTRENTRNASKCGGKQARKARGIGFDSVPVIRVSRLCHSQQSQECTEHECKGNAAKESTGNRAGKSVGIQQQSKEYPPALYLTSMHTHMHTQCKGICTGMQAGASVSDARGNQRRNSEEIRREFCHGRKPIAELNLNLGPRLGPSIHLRTFRFSRFAPYLCDPSERRALLVPRVRSAVPCSSATAGV